MSWWQQRMVGFDLETTSPLPEEARIVSASVAFCGGGESTDARSWLADPGVEVPEEASAVHGITTERARAEGAPAGVVLGELLRMLGRAVVDGKPLVIFNARYDLTVLDREARRRGYDPLPPELLLCVDPSVIDKQLDRYRRSYPYGVDADRAKDIGIPSSRTLEGMALHYGAKLDGAHDATFDAIAACRVAWVIGARGRVVRRVRSSEEAIELRELQAEWAGVRGDLGLLHRAQQRWALAERDRFAEYKRSIGEHDEAARISAEVGWPVLDVMDHEEVAG